MLSALMYLSLRNMVPLCHSHDSPIFERNSQTVKRVIAEETLPGCGWPSVAMAMTKSTRFGNHFVRASKHWPHSKASSRHQQLSMEWILQWLWWQQEDEESSVHHHGQPQKRTFPMSSHSSKQRFSCPQNWWDQGWGRGRTSQKRNHLGKNGRGSEEMKSGKTHLFLSMKTC